MVASRWPDVSVVVPTRDRPELLARAVRSVLTQDYAGVVECLVVVDRGPVPSPLGAHELADRRSCRTLRNTRSAGLPGARNTGVLAATGALIGFCDDDDWWEPGKLTAQVRLLQGDPDLLVVSCGIAVHSTGRRTVRLGARVPVTQRDLFRDRHMEINPCTVLTWREHFVQTVGLVDEQIPGGYAEDYEWLLRAVRCSPVVNVPEALVNIAWHESSHFAGRWQVMAAALQYLLERHPEFGQERRGYARVAGQIAFASAAARDRRAAWRWIAAAVRADWREPRALLAGAVLVGVASPDRVVSLAHRLGRGV